MRKNEKTISRSPSDDGPGGLLTLTRCADLAACSRRFLEIEIGRGRLRSVRLGRLVRIHAEEWHRYTKGASQ